jgi:hypothetical protein
MGFFETVDRWINGESSDATAARVGVCIPRIASIAYATE